MPDISTLFTDLPLWQWKLLLAVPLIPLVGYVIQIFWGKHLPRKGDWLLTGGMGIVMLITIYMFFVARGHSADGNFIAESARDGFGTDWLYRARPQAEGGSLPIGLMYDGLGAGMLAVVGIVSFFVHLFATGYMKGDRRYHIFFANISLFTFAMLGLVVSDNILFLFIFWELMGLMSYLLIGHFSHDPTSHRIKQAAAACKKAFLTTRVGDTCLLFGMAMFYFLLPEHFNELVDQGKIHADKVGGTFKFTELWQRTTMVVQANGGDYPVWMTCAGLFIFGGTVGKSAQFPLHIWLPDAMEGPTPVSAMIHAATMVAAGVFLLGRTFPLMSPTVLAIVAGVGALTALFAATIGCTVYDIKGVLAYSTISQLGFMVAAIGCGALGLVAGLFHMVTHAFFKACLFLSAGSVIHGCHHEQDMRKMGGLRKKMPITFACMLICTLAIAGMPLFSGFYSKDRIIAAAFGGASLKLNGGAFAASVFLPIAACLTTFYMFRLIFMTFFGEPRDHHVDEHAHESPRNMTISLMALAALGMFGGYFWLMHPTDPLGGHGTWFTQMVDWRTMYPGVDLTTTNLAPLVAGLDHRVDTAANDLEHYYHGFNPHWTAMIASIGVLIIGIVVAVQMYLRRKWSPDAVTSKLGIVYETVANKYYIDEGVNASVIKGTTKASAIQKWIDENIVDGLVLTVGRFGKGLGFFTAIVAVLRRRPDAELVGGVHTGLLGAERGRADGIGSHISVVRSVTALESRVAVAVAGEDGDQIVAAADGAGLQHTMSPEISGRALEAELLSGRLSILGHLAVVEGVEDPRLVVAGRAARVVVGDRRALVGSVEVAGGGFHPVVPEPVPAGAVDPDPAIAVVVEASLLGADSRVVLQPGARDVDLVVQIRRSLELAGAARAVAVVDFRRPEERCVVRRRFQRREGEPVLGFRVVADSEVVVGPISQGRGDLGDSFSGALAARKLLRVGPRTMLGAVRMAQGPLPDAGCLAEPERVVLGVALDRNREVVGAVAPLDSPARG